ncbi:MAG: flippase-like domain-containing protein [Chloroflexi bacterium]|nr:flippase-like domain-containing protein [Chloroflexota bacterium]
MKMLKSVRFWIGMGISALTLWLAIRVVPFNSFQSSLAQADFIWLIPAVLVQFLAVWSRAERWMVLLGKKGILKTTYWGESIGFLFTNVLPLRMGEPARAVVVSEKAQIPLVQVAGSILVERVLDVATVVFGLALVLPFMDVPKLVSDAGLTFGAIVLVALVMLWFIVRFRQQSERLLQFVLKRFTFLPGQAIQARWGELVDGLAPLTHWRSGLLAVFWSLVSWVFSISIYWFVLRAYQPNPTAVEAIFIVVALALAIAVPSSPGFIGVFQYVGQQALVLPFHGKYTPSSALAITLTSHLVYYLITTGLGIVGLWKIGESFARIGERIMTRRRVEKEA